MNPFHQVRRRSCHAKSHLYLSSIFLSTRKGCIRITEKLVHFEKIKYLKQQEKIFGSNLLALNTQPIESSYTYYVTTNVYIYVCVCCVLTGMDAHSPWKPCQATFAQLHLHSVDSDLFGTLAKELHQVWPRIRTMYGTGNNQERIDLPLLFTHQPFTRGQLNVPTILSFQLPRSPCIKDYEERQHPSPGLKGQQHETYNTFSQKHSWERVVFAPPFLR